MGIFGSDDILFKNQDYHKLRKAAEDSGELFVDNEFPAINQSVSNKSLGYVEWKRPSVSINYSIRVFITICIKY